MKIFFINIGPKSRPIRPRGYSEGYFMQTSPLSKDYVPPKKNLCTKIYEKITSFFKK